MAQFHFCGSGFGVFKPFLEDNVGNADEVFAFADGYGEGNNFFTEEGFDLFHKVAEVHVFAVDFVDENNTGQADFFRIFPHAFGAHLHACCGVDDHKGCFRRAKGADGFADKIHISRRVDNVEFHFTPFDRNDAGADRCSTILFFFCEVGHGIFLIDVADLFGRAGLIKHGFGKIGFTRSAVTD